MSLPGHEQRALEAYKSAQRASNIRAIVAPTAPTVCANVYLGAIVRPKLSTYINR